MPAAERSRTNLGECGAAAEGASADVGEDDASEEACGGYAGRVAWPSGPVTLSRTEEDSERDCETFEGGEEDGRGREDSRAWEEPMHCQLYDDTWMVIVESAAIAVAHRRMFRATLVECAATKRTTYGGDSMKELAF